MATSVTETFLKDRVSTPTLDKWSSGFTAVKKFAEDKNVPLIGVWSNGDACGYCKKFETVCMDPVFKNWMSTSGCAFWFGYSGDKSADDKLNGTGCTWARTTSKGKLTTFPFVRVYWKSGNVDQAASGNSWINSSSTGAAYFVKKLQTLLKDYKPSTNESCNGGSCNDNGCDSDCSSGDCCTDILDICSKISAAKAKVADAMASLQDAAKVLDAVESSCTLKD